MRPPLITIGVTAFNAAETVARAVESALAQSYRPVEILIVDDASTDDTVQIVEGLAAQHPEIRVLVNNVNSGVAVSRNRIVAEAQGVFIAFFDDDDVSAPDRLERQLARLVAYETGIAHGTPVVCHAAREQIYPDGSRRIERTVGEAEERPGPQGSAVARRILAGAPLVDAYGSCATCSQMARTETYRALGGFDPAFRRGEDTDFALRFALAGGHFIGIGDPLVTQTMTKTEDKDVAGELRWRLALFDKHRGVFLDEAERRFCYDWHTLKCRWLTGRYLTFAGGLAGLALRHPLRAAERLRLALPNIGGNRAFARFHRQAVD